MIAPAHNPVNDILRRMRAKALDDHYFFSKFVLGHKDLTPSVHGPISLQLKEAAEGKHRQHKFVMPRGSLKTTHVTIAGAMWLACRNPNILILIVQNTVTNAARRLKAIEGHFQANELFKAMFPELMPDKDCQWNSIAMQVKRPGIFGEATFTASGTRTKLTSNHFDVIIEDDTVSPDLDDMSEQNVTPNPEDIEQAIGWHASVTPLFVNPATGVNIVVGTRWAERDLLAWIDERQPTFCCYERAALELDGLPDDRGEPIYPERLSREVLEQVRAAMGDYLFAANYMNRPMNGESMPFRLEWIRPYEEAPPLDQLEVYTTVDLASDNSQTRSKRTDFNVVLTTGRHLKTGIIYVLEYWMRKANPTQVIEEICGQQKRWKPLKVGIEGVSYQNTLRHWLLKHQNETHNHFLVEQLHVGNRAKHTKIMGLQPIFAAGGILIGKQMNDLRSQLTAFPYGANDDVLDALSMQIEFWNVTQRTDQIKPQGDDVYRLEDAEAELRGRFAPRGAGVMDVLALGSGPMNFTRGNGAWN